MHRSVTARTEPGRWVNKLFDDPKIVRLLVISVYLSSLLVTHLSDAPRRRLIITGNSARIQNKTTESSACSLILSQTTNFGLFRTERVCRRPFQIWWKWLKVHQSCRTHWEKRRNCSLLAISPFPTEFSKDLYCRHVKTRACLGKD